MEIRRFGVGHRRPDGPPGTVGVSGQLIHADGRGVIAELAFGRRASVPPHTNTNSAWFIVLEGGGFVRVGDERARVAAGEAVAWPAGVPHAAWTELSEMRAMVVELAGADDAILRGILDAGAGATPGGEGGQDRPVERGVARLVGSAGDPWAGDPSADLRRASADGEPL